MDQTVSATGDITIDSSIIAALLGLDIGDLEEKMRAGQVTCRCERDADANPIRYRITFLHRRDRARIEIDGSGRVLKRSAIRFDRRLK